ncbi:MAG: c-type cytochrome [Dongiaceae bacterium]
MRAGVFVLILWLAAWLAPAVAAGPALKLAVGGRTASYSAADLLARPDLTEVKVLKDPGYGKPMTYRAVPLAALVAPLGMKADDTLEVVALDGFVAQLPGTMVLNQDPLAAVAMVTVEDPAQRWPNLPGKHESAGPFSVVWSGATAAAVPADQWPYQVAAMNEVEPPEKRWPQLALDSSVPPNDPLRLGLQKFVATCGACHQLDGGGAANVGPDLNRPMSPTEYFAAGILRKYIRDPASVRDWPARQMPGFTRDALSDDDLDQIILYLSYKARHRR